MSHALIVGGTRGLGREVVRILASRGSQVSVIGRRDPPEGDRQIPNVRHWIADLLDGEAALRAAESAVGRIGPLNYLIFCQRYRGKDNDWAGEIQVSLTATKQLIEALAPKFAPEGDRGIVLVSSVFGDRVGEGQPLSYHLGKAGINHMARFYAVSLGRKGIRVNVVTPFTFLKEESKDFYLNNKELYALYQEMIPLGRMGTAEDSANAVVFLCSPAASFINGQNLYVDGGLSAVWPETLARKLKSI
jgi:NAD(P)-dependent dehydrogenase (short-subunit alcohol dehydrogenase family)